MKYILILFAAIMLVGCSKINGFAITRAESVCKDHQGILSIYQDANIWNVMCNDGNGFYDIAATNFHK
jgi:uncharacterized protein YcfL